MSICMESMCGSKGCEIGKIVSGKLGYEFYDLETIDRAISGDPHLKEIYMAIDYEVLPPICAGSALKNELNRLRSQFIQQAAKQKNCFFWNCGAARTLKKAGLNHTSVLLTAAFDERMAHSQKQQGSGKLLTWLRLKREDARRKREYKRMTGGNWLDPSEYHLCIHSEEMDDRKTAEFLLGCMREV